jgi:hypothetical protein
LGGLALAVRFAFEQGFLHDPAANLEVVDASAYLECFQLNQPLFEYSWLASEMECFEIAAEGLEALFSFESAKVQVSLGPLNPVHPSSVLWTGEQNFAVETSIVFVVAVDSVVVDEMN